MNELFLGKLELFEPIQVGTLQIGYKQSVDIFSQYGYP